MSSEEKIIFCRTAKSSLICLQRKTGWNRSMRMFTRIHFWESIWQRKWQSAALSQQVNKELIGCLDFEAILYEE